MASERQALMLILLTTFFFTIKPSQASTAGSITIYWGQNNGDGNLTSTCDTGNFEIVNLAFLHVFGCGSTPSWNFAGHCGDWNPCSIVLEPQIRYCQQKGVKVFLSIGGAIGTYSLCSSQDAKEVANYLYQNFLIGKPGPLGSVTLEGIDFDIELGSDAYWDDLAKELDALRHQNDHYFYLSAAPPCIMPVDQLDNAIKTGLFDYVNVQFYNKPQCQYSIGNTQSLFNSWDNWTSYVLPNNSVLLGLPASPDAARGGYIPPQVLISEVLPYVKLASNYGGVMLWDRYHDVINHYSDLIKDYVPKYAMRFVTAVSDAIYESVSAAMHRILQKKPY